MCKSTATNVTVDESISRSLKLFKSYFPQRHTLVHVSQEKLLIACYYWHSLTIPLIEVSLTNELSNYVFKVFRSNSSNLRNVAKHPHVLKITFQVFKLPFTVVIKQIITEYSQRLKCCSKKKKKKEKKEKNQGENSHQKYEKASILTFSIKDSLFFLHMAKQKPVYSAKYRLCKVTGDRSNKDKLNLLIIEKPDFTAQLQPLLRQSPLGTLV